METYCLFADDGKSAEYLVSHVINDDKMKSYVGVALFPEALSVFERNRLNSAILDDYINRSEHEKNGIDASNLIFRLNQMLGLDSATDHSFYFENLDLLHSVHFFTYLIIGYVFYYLTTIAKVLREINPKQVFAIDLVRPIESPLNLRSKQRSLFTKTLLCVCNYLGIPVKLLRDQSPYSNDSISGLDISKYICRNKIRTYKSVGLVHRRRYLRQSLLNKCEAFLRHTNGEAHFERKSSRGILYLGNLSYYREIINVNQSSSTTQYRLDYSDSTNSYFDSTTKLNSLNIRYLINHFFDKVDEERVNTYSVRTGNILRSIVKNDLVENEFVFNGISYFDIFYEYLDCCTDDAFTELLKIYLSMKNFSRKANIRFALAYCGWTLPQTYSIHQALKANNCFTAYFSHGLNIANRYIAPIIKGDGTVLPCDILCSPSQEFEAGHVKNALKDNRNNFVTGFPFYSIAKRTKNPILKYILKKALSLDCGKQIILYPLAYGSPHLHRPNGMTFTEEYYFVMKLIRIFNQNAKYQLVIKSKHVTVPDKNYLKLFERNVPKAVLRYGPLPYFLKVTDVCINFNSSSGFDALLAGIPVIYYKLNDRHDWFEPYASKNGKPNYFFYAENVQEIPNLCDDIINGNVPEWYEDKMKEVPGKFMPYTGHESARRIGRVIREFM